MIFLYSITRLKNSSWRSIFWWSTDCSWRPTCSKSWRDCRKVWDQFQTLHDLSKYYIHSSQLRRPIMKPAIIFSFYEKKIEQDYWLNDASQAIRFYLPSIQNSISVFDFDLNCTNSKNRLFNKVKVEKGILLRNEMFWGCASWWYCLDERTFRSAWKRLSVGRFRVFLLLLDTYISSFASGNLLGSLHAYLP